MRRILITFLFLTLLAIPSVPLSMYIKGRYEQKATLQLMASDTKLADYIDLLGKPSGIIEPSDKIVGGSYRTLVDPSIKPKTGRIIHWNREGIPYYWNIIIEDGEHIIEGWLAIPSVLPWNELQFKTPKKKKGS